MRSFRGFLLAGAVILAGYGCSAVNILRDDRHVRGFNYTPVKASETKLANEKFLYRYMDEWRFNRRHKDRPPGLWNRIAGVVADSEHLPFAAERFDAALLAWSL